jgi:hypothetical protein
MGFAYKSKEIEFGSLILSHKGINNVSKRKASECLLQIVN